jgi:hypothetical protein
MPSPMSLRGGGSGVTSPTASSAGGTTSRRAKLSSSTNISNISAGGSSRSGTLESSKSNTKDQSIRGDTAATPGEGTVDMASVSGRDKAPAGSMHDSSTSTPHVSEPEAQGQQAPTLSHAQGNSESKALALQLSSVPEHADGGHSGEASPLAQSARMRMWRQAGSLPGTGDCGHFQGDALTAADGDGEQRVGGENQGACSLGGKLAGADAQSGGKTAEHVDGPAKAGTHAATSESTSIVVGNSPQDVSMLLFPRALSFSLLLFVWLSVSVLFCQGTNQRHYPSIVDFTNQKKCAILGDICLRRVCSLGMQAVCSIIQCIHLYPLLDSSQQQAPSAASPYASKPKTLEIP